MIATLSMLSLMNTPSCLTRPRFWFIKLIYLYMPTQEYLQSKINSSSFLSPEPTLYIQPPLHLLTLRLNDPHTNNLLKPHRARSPSPPAPRRNLHLLRIVPAAF